MRPALLIFIALCSTSPVAAGEGNLLTDHFNSPALNSIWDIKTANGGYFINDWAGSRLVMVSSKVEEGVYLNYVQDLAGRYSSFEVRLDTSYLTDDIYVGFAEQIMTPGDNDEVNTHTLGGISVVSNGWWARMEDGLKQGKFQKGWHIFTVKSDGNFIETYIDGIYIGRKARKSGPIYFCISADAYTNYYTANVVIDYIKISHGE